MQGEKYVKIMFLFQYVFSGHNNITMYAHTDPNIHTDWGTMVGMEPYSAVLLFTFILLFLSSSPVSLSCFNLAVLIRTIILETNGELDF